mgnify:CR=1 FL=1
MGECTAQGKRAILAGERHDLGDGVLEEAARHAGGTNGADLLLVDDERDARALHVGHIDLSEHGRIGADTVVVAIAQNHGAVEAHVAGRAGGHDLDLGGEEVLLLDVILLLEDVQEHLLDGLLGGVLVVLVKLDGAAPTITSRISASTASLAGLAICSLERWISRSEMVKTGSSALSPMLMSTVVPSFLQMTPTSASGEATQW